jgi:hypothetical protein
MNHHSSKILRHVIQTVVVVAGAVLLNACPSSTFDLITGNHDEEVVGLAHLPSNTANHSVRGKLQILLRRHGFDGAVQLELQDLPAGSSAASVMLEANQDVASMDVGGLPGLKANATVRLRFAGLELLRSVPVSESKLIVDLPGGTHSQTVRDINSNLDPGAFVTHQVYANFKGSTCQVMVRSSNGGLYVCFNGPVQAGKTYNLVTARDPISGTASISYFQGFAASSSRQALWDSISGRVKVVAISGKKIEFSITGARFVPAKGFGKNLASGEFWLEASTTVTDISNL